MSEANFLWQPSRYIHEVYLWFLVHVISTHRRRIVLASFSRKNSVRSKDLCIKGWWSAGFATKTRQHYSPSVCRNNTNQGTQINFMYISRGLSEEICLRHFIFYKKIFSDFRIFSAWFLKDFLKNSDLVQKQPKNACRASCLEATRIRYTRNFFKIWVSRMFSLFRSLNS